MCLIRINRNIIDNISRVQNYYNKNCKFHTFLKKFFYSLKINKLQTKIKKKHHICFNIFT